MYQFFLFLVYRDVEMCVVLDLMKFDVYNVGMYIFLVYQVEIAINKSLFLLDHKENQILDNHLD